MNFRLRFLALIVMASAVWGCRDAHFDSSPIGYSQTLMSVNRSESRMIGKCEGRQDCYQMELSLWIKDQKGEALQNADVELTLKPLDRVLDSQVQARTGPEGLARFTFKFQQLATERGFRYATLFGLSAKALGRQNYCGTLSAFSSGQPLQNFAPCSEEDFKNAVFGETPQLDVIPSSVTLLKHESIDSSHDRLKLRATFRVLNLGEDRSLRDLDCQWIVQLPGSENSSGSARTTSLDEKSLGEVTFDFSISVNPFENEQLHLIRYELLFAGIKTIFKGEMGIDTFSNSRQILVTYSKENDPFPLSEVLLQKNNQIEQSLILEPLLFQFQPETSGYSVDSGFRLGEIRSYRFSFELRIRQSRRNPELKNPRLEKTPIKGKVFLLQPPSTVLHEWNLNTQTDEKGAIYIAQSIFVENFSIDPRSVYFIVALESPDFPQVPSLLRQITPRSDSNFETSPLARADAERILGSRLQISAPRRESPQSPDPSTYLLSKGFIPMDRIDEKSLSRNARLLFLELLKLDWAQLSQKNWEEIYRLFYPPKSALDAKALPPVQTHLNAYRLAVAHKRGSPAVIEVVTSPLHFGPNEAQWEKVNIQYDFSGYECLVLSLIPPTGGEALEVFYCPPELRQIRMTDYWQRLKFLGSSQDILLREGEGFERNLSTLEKQNYFLHPERHQAGYIRELLWPR